MNKRNVIIVDGFQCVILDVIGEFSKHMIYQWKHEWAKEENIPFGGVGCVFIKPEEGLRKWKPQRKR